MPLPSRARMTIALLVAATLTASTAVAADLVVEGTSANDVLSGTAAAESFYGRGGDDLINAGDGDDELDGGPGADTLRGGEGTDVVSYGGSTPVEASLDTVANDGATGEKDNIGPDVEDLFGGGGDDRLTGSSGPNTLDGGAGNDRVTGGTGPDALFGGEGDDVVDARDAELDRIECGPGNDTAIVDEEDEVAADCETIARPTLTPGLTLNAAKRKLIISNVAPRSAVRLVCVDCKGKNKPLIDSGSVKLASGGIVKIGLPSKIRRHTIELGVRAPGASPVCVRYRVAKNYRYTVLRKEACTTAAKDL